jgi:competence ComEA-like helix-hairpin-helix protein
MTQKSSPVEPAEFASGRCPSPLGQPQVHALIAVASIAACIFFAWKFPTRTVNQTPTHVGIELDLNTASPRELSLVPGIGPVLAKRIIENRQRLGEFPTVESLQRVNGIGPKTVELVATICVVQEEQPRLASK